MSRTNLLPTLLLASVICGSAYAEQGCPDLGAPRHLGIASGQDAALIMGRSKRVKAPTHRVPFPSGSLDTVSISLSRSLCYGSCPSYSVELKGDGSAHYTGGRFVLVGGSHSYDVSIDSVRCLLSHLKQANFWSLSDKYVADITDGPTYSVSVTIGAKTKTITDYFGTAVGMPVAIKAIEDEIDSIGADTWVRGSSDTVSNLQKEGFDFHSQAAAAMLANAAAKAPDDLVIGLIEAGAPVIDQTPGHLSAVVRAASTGRTAIVQALIAKGAFSDGSPDVKEDALISAAGSGDPLTVAEILKYQPNVNAQDKEGNTALINMWNSQYGGKDKSKTDIPAVTRLLLKAGADPNIPNRSGSTALFSATNAEAVNLLIEAGGKIDVMNQYGSTPLLFTGTDEAAVALIQAGADTSVVNKLGETIEKIATTRKFTKTLEILRK